MPNISDDYEDICSLCNGTTLVAPELSVTVCLRCGAMDSTNEEIVSNAVSNNEVNHGNS